MLLLPCCRFGLLARVLPLLFLLSEVQGDCGKPDIPNYATLKNGTLKESYPVGTVLQYQCISGYQNIPGVTPSIECLNNSIWSDIPVFCRAKKCSPPPLDNGRITASGDLSLGDTVTFSCEEGYRLIGSKTSRCVVSDNTVVWRPSPPICQIIPCFPPPQIANGSHSGDPDADFVYGNVVTYKCDPDFTLIGNPSISCTVAENGVDGKWIGPAPECKVVQCRRPEINNGKLSGIFQATYPYDHGIVIECHAGYTLNGSNYIKCGANSLWLPAVPTCFKSDCGKPDIPNYATLQNGTLKESYPVGTVLQYQCIPGYQNIPGVTPSIQCLDNSTWSNIPTFCRGSGNTIFAIGQLTLILAILALIV